MEQAVCCGLMEQSMMETGSSTKPMARASSTTLMAMSMKVSGRATKQVATESTQILKGRDTKANGKTTSSTAKAMKPGRKELATRVTTSRAKRKAAESTLGQMDRFTKESG